MCFHCGFVCPCSGHVRPLNVRIARIVKLSQQRSFSEGERKLKGIDVNVIRPSASRVPLVSAALAASCVGVGVLVVQKQRWEQEAERQREADALQKAKLESEAALALAEAAKAKAAAAEKAAKQEAEAEEAARAQEAAKRAHEAELKLQEASRKKQTEFAALAGQCSQLLADLKLVAEAADFAEVEELSEFLRRAQVFLDGDAFKSLQESSLDGAAELTGQCAYALQVAKDHLAKMSRTEAVEKQFEAAAAQIRAERRKWLLGEGVDMPALTSALSKAEAAISELKTCGLDLWTHLDESQTAAARQIIANIEESEQKQQSWEQQRQALHQAVLTQDAPACEEALKSDVGSPLSAARAIAEEIQNLPKTGYNDQIASATQQLMPLLPDQVQVDEYTAAATAASHFLTSPELLDQASSLAEALAAQYALEKQELAHSWQLLLQEWKRQNGQDISRVVTEFEDRMRTEKIKVIEDHQQSAAERCEEAVTEAAAEMQEMADKDIYNLQSAQMQSLWAELSQVREGLSNQLHRLEQAPAQLQELWSSQSSPDTQAMSVSRSALTLLALREDEGYEGHPNTKRFVADGKDNFANKMLAGLATELKRLGQDSSHILTRQELQRNFHSQLPELVAAVFEPQAGLASSLIGRIFGKMYILKGEQQEASLHAAIESTLGQWIPGPEQEHTGSHRDSQKHNLRTLALAAQLVDTGKLQEAVDTLESSLSGTCRSRAHSWMSLVRATLLLQQTSRALLARSSCLSASLSGHV